MKKTAYITPLTRIYKIAGPVVLNTISNPTTTNVTGLGVSTDAWDGDARVKGDDYDDFWD